MIVCSAVFFIFLLLSRGPLTAFSKEKTIFLKALLPYGVILHHFFKYENVPFFSTDFKPLGTFVVGIFFFISGYGLFTKYLTDPWSINLGYVGKILKRILVPLIVIAAFYQMINALFGGNFSLDRMANDFLLGIPPLPFSWFCITYVHLVLIFFVYQYVKKKLKIRIPLLVFLSLYLILQTKLSIVEIPFWHYNMIFAFEAGVVYKLLEDKLTTVWASIVMVVFVLFCCFVVVNNMFGIVQEPSKLVFVKGFACSFGFVYLYNHVRLKTSDFFYYLSKISYESYLMQGVSFIIINNMLNDCHVFLKLILLLTVNFCLSSLFVYLKNCIIKREKHA